MIEVIQVSSQDQIEQIRRLFVEYAQTVNADSCFQDFDSEVQKLPGSNVRITRPDGLLSAHHGHNRQICAW